MRGGTGVEGGRVKIKLLGGWRETKEELMGEERRERQRRTG